MSSTFGYQKKTEMRTRYFFMTLMIGVFSITAFAQDQSDQRKKEFNLDDNIAIDGYDPVAYFKVNKAVKGKKDLAVSHQGVIYHFSSAENKEEFKKNPDVQAIISADKDVPHGRVVGVLDIIKTTGVKKFAISIQKN